MAKVVNVAEAKAKLSELLEAALRGEEVIIAKRGKPLVRLMPEKPQTRELGFLDFDIPDSFFEPLPEEELAAWYGENEA
ncbi:type II toxin-antitoxin system Phd/YefM family antitoxin [Oceanithermus desulfurans]|uniref:Antitoxin n=2 Tax=Oceanithermus desulfurans TaxID=227924 RepID=A0A511RLG3_9DEIN|nr:type II toxin-antitoxin system prevent-host-death family antitoxin [Oceanithermus desulfurans]MBB6028985.1 prevent-host-death family protein [Oceanithermus desulfurans]GEM90504.1 antitoxin [Oceanithermus desulfurans NBRC 100063]